MAQEVEHILGKDEVTGSSPVSSFLYMANKKCWSNISLPQYFLLAYFLLIIYFFAKPFVTFIAQVKSSSHVFPLFLVVESVFITTLFM